jgi:ABC-type multidrug transport system permease subunit
MSNDAASTSKGEEMWWFIGGGILYAILLFTLGLMTLRNGHGWMFFFGIFFPVLWLFGAFMRPTRTEYA